MHPPQYVQDELERIHPWARFGWTVNHATGEEGGFYIVQLVKTRIAEYEYAPRWDGWGPIFGTDFDRMQRVPFAMAGPFHPRETAWGDVLKALKETLTPVAERRYKTNRAKGVAYDDAVKDLAGQMGQFLYWKSQQTGAASDKTQAQKFLTDEERAVLAGERMQDLRGTFTGGK